MKRHVFSIMFSVMLIACSGDPIAQRDEFFASGQEYQKNQQYEEAVIQYLNALKADDRFVPARLALAETYEAQGNVQGAIGQYQRIVEQNQQNVEARLKLGTYYLAAGIRDSKWFEEARKLAEEALVLEPESVPARILLGNSYAGLQDFDRSIEAMQKALESDPGNLDAYLNLGASQFGRNNPEAAEQAFQEAVRMNPSSSKAYLGLGNFYAFSGRFDQAEEAFRKAFELDRSDQNSIMALVRLYMSQRKPDQAIAVFEEAISASEKPVPLQIALANFQISLGRTDEGVSLLERLRADNPGNRDLTLRLAEIRLGESENDEAASLVESILEADDRDAEAHYLKGQVLVRKEDFENALVEVNRAIELKPYFSPPYLVKTDLLQRQGRITDAEVTIRQVLEFDRGNLLARARLAKLLAVQKKSTADLENALAEATMVLEQLPQNSDALVARAEANLGLNRLAEARADFEQLQKANPDNPFYLHRLGTLAALEGNSEEALRLLRQALAQNAALTDVINDLIFVLTRDGRYDDALQELDRLAAQSDQKWLFHLFKGRVYLAQSDYAPAEREIRQAMELNPDNSQPYLLLGQVMVSQGKYQEAVQEVDALLAKSPNLAPAQLLRAYYLDAGKDTQGAIEGYRKSIQLFNESEPGYAAAANNLAWLLAVNGENLTEARTLAQKARQLDPDNRSYADTLGWVYYLMGNYTLAVDQLLYSVNLGNQNAEHYYRLGMAYAKKGDTILAKQTLRRALEIKPDFEGADEARRTLESL